MKEKQERMKKKWLQDDKSDKEESKPEEDGLDVCYICKEKE
jgi:hypothetical protein